MKLKAAIAALIAIGISSPLWASGLYELNVAYEQDVLRDQMDKFDMLSDQNQPGGFDQPCGWTCRINVSGWINTDAYLANRPPVFLAVNTERGIPNLAPLAPTKGGRASDLLLNNANLFVDARVNNWMTAKASLVYSSLTAISGLFPREVSDLISSFQGPYALPNSLFIYAPVNNGSGFSSNLDTAYATIGNFQRLPFYLRVGKEYVPFGQYDPYAFVQSENPTQLFTAINAPTVQLGVVIPNGFYGSIYTFAGNRKLTDGGFTRRIQNGGVDVDYAFNGFDKKVNLNAGYVANIADANFLSSYYTSPFLEFSAGNSGFPPHKAPAYDVNADVTFGPFDANGHYVATTRGLTSPTFLAVPIDVLLDIFPPGILPALTLKKFKAWGLEAGLTFPAIAHQSRIAIGYQQTSNLATFLPRRRLYIDYMMNIAKWFDMGVAVFQDRDYSAGEGSVIDQTTSPVTVLNPSASGARSTVGQLRASIKFA